MCFVLFLEQFYIDFIIFFNLLTKKLNFKLSNVQEIELDLYIYINFILDLLTLKFMFYLLGNIFKYEIELFCGIFVDFVYNFVFKVNFINQFIYIISIYFFGGFILMKLKEYILISLIFRFVLLVIL